MFVPASQKSNISSISLHSEARSALTEESFAIDRFIIAGGNEMRRRIPLKSFVVMIIFLNESSIAKIRGVNNAPIPLGQGAIYEKRLLFVFSPVIVDILNGDGAV